MTFASSHNVSESPRRHRSRLLTNLPAKLIALSGTSIASLLDLSLTGARLQMPERCSFAEELRARTDATLQWFEFETFCTIKWVKKVDGLFEIGLHFDEPINPQIVLATREIYDQFCEQGGYTSIVKKSAQNWVSGL